LHQVSLFKNNFINILNETVPDLSTKTEIKLVKSNFEMVMNLGRDENEYKNFKITNPNEDNYKKMVNF
jgi:hypothetical protein